MKACTISNKTVAGVAQARSTRAARASAHVAPMAAKGRVGKTTFLGNSFSALAAQAAVSAKMPVGIVAQAVASEKTIEDETYVDEVPWSLLQEGCRGDGSSMREKFEKMIRAAQDDITAAITEADGKEFHQDAWTRPGGGGGISRVLQDGNVWEKAGVNVSVVYGSMPPEAYRAATGSTKPIDADAGRVPFFAAGISSVMHPKNPMAPTMHFNYRYFETDEWNGLPKAWWFGGGTDLTPSYVIDEDAKHFHGTYKAVCDEHDPEYYAKFKKWADEYFIIGHRGETRGIGGIFFDDQNDRDPDTIFKFSTACAAAVVPSYVPLVVKHKDDPFTEEQKEWQQMRRGRYVEFNLVYDRGTTFGLKTGGRIESILMSLPLTARWQYDFEPEEGTPERYALECFRKNPEWCA
eukprot:CAMPEP_0182913644 /NCGR_PEP_ID=MMETSP0034_2-20130328/38147_1 /TAXON_ID=156128 /ORGANISM="Nephroselmis pyriformis, Strain CCMP717" /LENGTH=406 /DNA_ID=CAMNT_0025050371 /DNA_START=15 /DNA_END=1235 /DNA_ORIENTATION=-